VPCNTRHLTSAARPRPGAACKHERRSKRRRRRRAQKRARGRAGTPSAGRLGKFLVQAQFQGSVHSSALFLTAAAQNLLCMKLASELGVAIASPWVTWFTAALAPALVGLAVTPLIMYKARPLTLSLPWLGRGAASAPGVCAAELAAELGADSAWPRDLGAGPRARAARWRAWRAAVCVTVRDRYGPCVPACRCIRQARPDALQRLARPPGTRAPAGSGTCARGATRREGEAGRPAGRGSRRACRAENRAGHPVPVCKRGLAPLVRHWQAAAGRAGVPAGGDGHAGGAARGQGEAGRDGRHVARRAHHAGHHAGRSCALGDGRQAGRAGRHGRHARPVRAARQRRAHLARLPHLHRGAPPWAPVQAHRCSCSTGTAFWGCLLPWPPCWACTCRSVAACSIPRNGTAHLQVCCRLACSA